MKNRRKRVTISLPADLVDLVDRSSRELRETRSGLMEDWLRQSAQLHSRAEYEREIRDYYLGRSARERAEDEAMARASTRAFQALDTDDARGPFPGRSRSKRWRR